MNAMKSLLAVSVSALGAVGAANAAAVGTYSTLVLTGTVSGVAFGLTVTGAINGSGTSPATLSGTELDVATTQVSTTNIGSPNTITGTSSFLGAIAAGVFTPTSGGSTALTCSPAGTGCSVVLANPNTPFATISGSVAAVLAGDGGTINTTLTELGGGVTATETWTFSNFVSPPVIPLPPAVWLLGSGLVGLVGAARHRRATKP
jgi:hypothetical protein